MNNAYSWAISQYCVLCMQAICDQLHLAGGILLQSLYQMQLTALLKLANQLYSYTHDGHVDQMNNIHIILVYIHL